MSFLHRMHNVIIRKVQLTLEKCDADDDCEFDADIFEDDISVNRTTIDQEQEEELRRYVLLRNIIVYMVVCILSSFSSFNSSVGR